MKICEKCKNSYPANYALDYCDAQTDTLGGLRILCAGKVIDVHCAVCLDKGFVEIRDPRFPTPELVPCKRGCHQFEVLP